MSGASFENPDGEVAILAGTRAESLGTSAFHCGLRNTSVQRWQPRAASHKPISQRSRPKFAADFASCQPSSTCSECWPTAKGTFLPLISMVSAVFAKLELEPRHRKITILLTRRRTDARYMWEQQLRIAPESNSDTL